MNQDAQTRCLKQLTQVTDWLVFYTDLALRKRIDRDLMGDVTSYLSDKRERYIKALERLQKSTTMKKEEVR
jgi:hypothetical protein